MKASSRMEYPNQLPNFTKNTDTQTLLFSYKKITLITLIMVKNTIHMGVA